MASFNSPSDGLYCQTVGGDQCPCKFITINSSVWTAAAMNDYKAILAISHRNRSSLKRIDKYGYTALHYAAQHNFIDIVRFLLENGVDVDANTCGATPLHRAAYRGSFDACKVLLEKGADVNAKDSSFGDNLTPIQKAYSQNHADVVALLISYGAMLDENAVIACNNYSKHDIDVIVDNNLTFDQGSNNKIGDLASSISSEPKSYTQTHIHEQVAVSTNHADINIVKEIIPTGRLCVKCNEVSLILTQTPKGNLLCNKCWTRRF